MKSGLRLLASQNKPPIPLGAPRTGGQGLRFNLGAGRQDRETFMRQYGMSGTIYSIVSLLAESTATPVWKLYKKNKQDGRVRYTTGDKGSDQRIEVVDHPALRLWDRPNSFHTGFEFREAIQQHQELTGETFWVVETETLGYPTDMWHVRPDRMTPVPDPNGYLIGWVYTSDEGVQIPLSNDMVILEKRPDPLDQYRGVSPVAAVLPNIQQQRYATEYQRNLFLNGADPGGVITIPNKLDEREYDELVDRWREAHQGVARAGRVGVLEDGAQWTPNSNTNKDMEYAELRLNNRDELREAWRIHKAMLGTSDDVNRANAQTAQEVFVGWQVIPRLNRRRDTLNNKLLPLFGAAGKGVEFDYEDPSPENAETAATELLAKSQAAATLVQAGFDMHDVLEVVGLPDMGIGETTPVLPPVTPETPPALQNRAREVINVTQAPQQPPQELNDVDTQWKLAVAALVSAWAVDVTAGWYTSLLKQIRSMLTSNNLVGLTHLSVDTTDAKKLLLDHATKYANRAAQQAADEATAQGIHGVAPHTASRRDLKEKADVTAEFQASHVALAAGREAARIAPGADIEDVMQQLSVFLNNLSDAQVVQAVSGLLSTAQNTSRLATIAAGPRAQLVATEMHDSNTCSPCKEVDGHVFGFSDDPGVVAEVTASYPGGGYVLCEGGARCRGTVYARYSKTTPSATSTLPVVRDSVSDLAELMRRQLNGYPQGVQA